MRNMISSDTKILQDFRKTLFSDLDRRFLIILFISILMEVMIVGRLSQRPVPEYTQEEIARIQERFANFILEEPVRRTGDVTTAIGQDGLASTGDEAAAEETVEDEGSGEDAGAGEGDGTGSGDASSEASIGRREISRQALEESRRRSREAISQEVSGKGLLGLLTGTGTAAEGDAVVDIFAGTGSGAAGNGDLDRVLASVDGLKTQGDPGGGGGSGGRGVKGGRSDGKATIDDLVSDLGTVSSTAMSRSGELKVETPEEVEGRGRKSIHRSATAIQEVLIRHNKAIQYCYERELKRNPSLKGKIVVRITVNAVGHVVDAVIVSSSLNNERVERCILARIKLWKDFKSIDDADGDVSFRQAYVFGY